MPKLNLRGIFPPIPTPFVDGEVAHDKLAQNVEKWCRTGIKGMVVLGSNGEYPLLSEPEKLQVVKTAVSAAPQESTIIAGTGCESTRETLKLTEQCSGLGAHAALVVTPHYYGGKMDKKALINHFTEVADHSPIPILLYNVTKFTHINLAPDVVAALSQHPNIAGIKDSAGNVAQLGEYLHQTGTQFEVLVGTASVLFGALTLGCTGGILALANVAPEHCIRIQQLVDQGDFTGAREIQLDMIPVNKAITATYGIAGLKAALDMIGYFGGDPRLPLLPATDKEKQEIEQILRQAGLLS